MEQRDEVPPSAPSQGVEGGALRSDLPIGGDHPEVAPNAHRSSPVFVPQITTPPPRLMTRARTSPIPAARHMSICSSSGWRRYNPSMLGPRNRPTSHHSLETTRPARGSTARV